MRGDARWTFTLLAAALVLLCAGCEGDDDDDTAGDDLACDVNVELSELIPTVATVTFSADLSGVDTAVVEFGLDDDYGMVAPAASDGAGGHKATLVGMKASMDYHFRPVFTAGGVAEACADQELTTGPTPTDLPGLDVTAGEGDFDGFFVMSLLSTPSAAVIVDRDGDYVWWHQEISADFPVPRAVLSHDRTRMLYLGRLPDEEIDYEHNIFQVALDGSTVDTLPVPDGHHDFLELPDGTFAVNTHDGRDMGNGEVQGDKVLEYDLDGNTTEIWSVWDWIDYDPEHPVDPGTAWTHTNALDYLPDEDVYYISVRNFDTIFGFERSTGEVFRTIGGILSDYELEPEDGEWFDKEHQFTIQGDDLLVFANGVDVQNGSRVLGYHLDDEAGVATNNYRYEAEHPLFCYTYGDVNRMPSGNMLVTWSTSGQLEEVDEAGEILYQLRASMGGGFGYTTFLESLYPDP
jgi:hypothetical protein